VAYPMVTRDLGRRVLVLLSPEQDLSMLSRGETGRSTPRPVSFFLHVGSRHETHSSGGDETDSVDGGVPHSDALRDLPDDVRVYPEVLGERTLGREFPTVDHPGHLVPDLQLVGVGADRGDGDDRTGKVASDDGTGDRKTRDRGVLPV